MQQHTVTLGQIEIANHKPFVLIAGPCQMESRDHALDMSGRLKEICDGLGISLIYKTSYDKANRTSLKGQRGMGLDKALAVFQEVKDTYKIPVLTDVHERDHCAVVADVVDVLQIPAFLCRQTDLLIAAAQTGRVVNVKKGQFLAPWDMKNVVAKLVDSGNSNVLVTERGASFGYNTSSGGQREFVPVLARAAVAVGVAALFMETHQDPDNAPSDGPNMVPIDQMADLLLTLQNYDRITKATLSA